MLDGDLPGVIRAKSRFRVATRPGWMAEILLAGAFSFVKPLGVVYAPEGLSAVHRTGCAAIWRRQPLRDFQSSVDGLDPDILPGTRVFPRPDAVGDTAGEIRDVSRSPAGPERDRHDEDMAVLADIFAEFLKPRWLRPRLDVVTTNPCCGFHIDAVSAPLVCDCRGADTQYGVLTDGSEPRCIVTLPTGAPILFCGTLWQDRTRSRHLHRSPPVESTGETGPVLVLDPVDDRLEEV